MPELKLSKPVEIDGEKKDVIIYDLENLQGNAIENAIKSMQKQGYVPTVQELDPILHAHIFAEAAGLDYLDIKKLSAKDYLKAVSAVRDFFLSESEDSPQENTSAQ
ncbi:MAG TPA: phage tail assembly protein [Thermoanaerobacterales bacterium]|nr:phage tail assembly protein [Thermoanaerobacterales bacterium]